MGISSGDCLDYLKRDEPPTIGGIIHLEEGKSEENQNKNKYELSHSSLLPDCQCTVIGYLFFSFLLPFPAIMVIFSGTLRYNKSFLLVSFVKIFYHSNWNKTNIGYKLMFTAYINYCLEKQH